MEQVKFHILKTDCLDNFSALKVIYDNVPYPTAEHAYQAQKFMQLNAEDTLSLFRRSKEQEEVWLRVFIATSPFEAKEIAQQNRHCVRDSWDDLKLSIMEGVFRRKLRQHVLVQDVLRESLGLKLVENSPTDFFWGAGIDGSGENHSGKIWMKLREGLISGAA